jgi:ankyrin repeat protein
MGEIFRAAEGGNEERVIRLLDTDPLLLEGEDDGYGDRPLAWAAFSGELGMVRLLMDRGANIDATGRYDGKTALHRAVEGGAEEVVALLLDKGAHANSRDEGGGTLLIDACDKGHLGVVKVLVQHMGGHELAARDQYGKTALHYAGYNGHEEVVRFLLLAGADPTITDNDGRTPRIFAEEDHGHRNGQVRQRRARCVAVLQVGPLTC